MPTSLKLNFGLLSSLTLILFICPSVSTLAQAENEGSEPAASVQKAGNEIETKQEESDESAEKADNGQADLDKAIEKKITVSSTRDLDDIADLCESAIEKGLDAESEAQAKQLWSNVLFQHAKQLNRAIAPNGTLSTRWRWLRQQAISRLDKAVEIKPDKVDAWILLAKLHSLNNGDRDAAVEAIEKAIAKITDDNQKTVGSSIYSITSRRRRSNPHSGPQPGRKNQSGKFRSLDAACALLLVKRAIC